MTAVQPRQSLTDGGRFTPAQRLTGLLFAVAFGTNVPTPLLLIYRQRLGLSSTTVTAVFASYAVGLVVSLLLSGPSADRVGRRRVVLGAAALAIAASLLFLLAAHHVVLLFVARGVQGVASGATFGVGSAWLRESLPDQPGGRAAKRASVAMNLGFCFGPLTAGLLGQYGPAPTVIPYLVHVLICSTALLAARRVPETLRHRAGGAFLRLALPASGRRVFWLLVVPAALPVFVFPSVISTVLPLLLGRTTPVVVVTGVVSGGALGAAAAAAPLAGRLGSWAEPVGIALGAIGLALAAVVAAAQLAWPVLLPLTVLLGIASGITLTAGLATAESIATDDHRAAVYAGFYVTVYLGFGAPVLVTALAGSRPAVPLLGLALGCAGLAGYVVMMVASGSVA